MLPIPIKIPDDNVAPIKLMPVIPSYIGISPKTIVKSSPSAPPNAIKE